MKKLFEVLVCLLLIFFSMNVRAEKVSYEAYMGKWRKVVLLDHAENKKRAYASFRVPPNVEVSESQKKKTKGEWVYYVDYTGEQEFMVGPGSCKPLQKMQNGANPLDVRCSYFTFYYVQTKPNYKWWAGESPDNYLSEKVSEFNDSDAFEKGKENVMESKDFGFTGGFGKEFIRLSRSSAAMFGQPLTREVVLFDRKSGKWDRVLHLGYVETN